MIFAEFFMPIYAYRCDACGFAKDVLQKVSDAPLSQCPSCNQSTFKKQLTAAGFQLKGSGWYVTDFRAGSGGAKPANSGDTPAAATGTSDASASSAPAESSSASEASATPATAGTTAAPGKAASQD
jgi:putative FmdB family regulatory protein